MKKILLHLLLFGLTATFTCHAATDKPKTRKRKTDTTIDSLKKNTAKQTIQRIEIGNGKVREVHKNPLLDLTGDDVIESTFVREKIIDSVTIEAPTITKEVKKNCLLCNSSSQELLALSCNHSFCPTCLCNNYTESVIHKRLIALAPYAIFIPLSILNTLAQMECSECKQSYTAQDKKKINQLSRQELHDHGINWRKKETLRSALENEIKELSQEAKNTVLKICGADYLANQNKSDYILALLILYELETKKDLPIDSQSCFQSWHKPQTKIFLLAC